MANVRRRCTVSNRLLVCHRDDFVLFHRHLCIVTGVGLDSDNLAVWSMLLANKSAARDEAAAANPGEEAVELADLIK